VSSARPRARGPLPSTPWLGALFIMELRDYQSDVIERVLAGIDAGRKSLLVGLFTGAGKTVIFVELANRIPGRTLIIAPLRELVWQAADKVRSIVGIDPALEMAEYQSNEDEWWSPKIVVACKQTLARGRYKKFTDIQLVIVDEAHMQYSPKCREMFEHFNDQGATVVGFTATPFRMDGEAMLA